MHTDNHAVEALFEELGLPIGAEATALQLEVDIAYIPPPYWPQARELLQQSQYIGCGHLRFALNNPEQYQIPQFVLQSFLVAFYDILWNEVSSNISNPALRLHNDEIQLLEGYHNEECVVIINSVPTVQSGDLCLYDMPLAIPHPHQNESCFIYHAESATYLRNSMAFTMWSVLGQPDEISVDLLRTTIDKYAAIQMNATLYYLARNAPTSNLFVYIGAVVQLHETNYLSIAIVVLLSIVLCLFVTVGAFWVYHKRQVIALKAAVLMHAAQAQVHAAAEARVTVNLRGDDDEHTDELL